MPVLSEEGRSFDEVEALGVAIRRIAGQQLHCGLLYKLDGETAQLLHLAFHHELCSEQARVPYRWANVGLDEDNKKVLAAFASLIAANPSAIPYGLDQSGSCFDPQTGQLLPPPIGKGLTCATFISTVLRAYGYHLLSEDTWPPRADDAEWGGNVAAWLRMRAADPTIPDDKKPTPEHIEGVEKDKGAKRFRPDEVVGAATKDGWPIAFQDARALADQIIGEL